MRLVLVWLALMGWSMSAQAAQSDTLARIRDSGEIRLGYTANAAPFSSIKDGSTEPAGYSVDLCRHIATGVRKQLGLGQLRTTWVPLTVQNRLAAVRDGKVDIECGTTTWTLSRQRDVDFSLVVFVDGASMLARKDANLHTLSDLKGAKIAVLKGTTTLIRLNEALARRKIDAQVVPVNERGDGLRLLERKEVAAFASDRVVLIGMTMASGAKEKYRLLDEDFSIEPYAFALRRGDPDFRLAVNRVLAGLFRSGEIDAVYERWLGHMGRPSLLLAAAYYMQGLAE